MKRVLIVKTSSLGDIIHTLPAVTEAAKHLPVKFDWLLEKSFAEIPAWHKDVKQVISLPFRQLRKNPFTICFTPEWKLFRQKLNQTHYDIIIDAQGLLKSAFLTRLAKGEKHGLDWSSAREKWASLAYHRKWHVDKDQHAILRTKCLFAQVFNYPVDLQTIDYGINKQYLETFDLPSQRYIVFLHGTTWETKHWPEIHWQSLLEKVTQTGYDVLLPWGNQEEHSRAQRLVNNSEKAYVLPKLSLAKIAYLLTQAKAVVAVDTGLGHLSAALTIPTISLYGPTNPKLVGTLGANQYHLTARFPCAPCKQRECTYQEQQETKPACFSSVTPERVWEKLKGLL